MKSTILNQIATAEAVSISGIKLSVPDLFADPGFKDYVNNSSIMTWHKKGTDIDPDDLADVAVFVDPSMTGEGTESDMPYWKAIVDKLKAVVGTGPYTGNHFVVILTNQ